VNLIALIRASYESVGFAILEGDTIFELTFRFSKSYRAWLLAQRHLHLSTPTARRELCSIDPTRQISRIESSAMLTWIHRAFYQRLNLPPEHIEDIELDHAALKENKTEIRGRIEWIRVILVQYQILGR